jgi:hypothetical protein
MATCFVPNLGPSVYMSAATEAWAERTGHKVERKEFPDVAAASVFARSILSRVEDEKGNVLWDARQPAPPLAPAPHTP